MAAYTRTHDLRSLQRLAQRQLAAHYAAPQRYGTAFHITAPYADVREIPVQEFVTGPAYAKATSGRPVVTMLENFLTEDVPDPYLLWHLAHLDVLPVHTLTVPAGETREVALSLPRGARVSNIVSVVLEEGSTLTVHDTVQQREMLLQRLFVQQQKGSTLTYWGVRGDANFVNESVSVRLVGEDATASITHLVVGTQKTQSDMAVSVHHEGPRTVSNVAVRALATDSARAVYRGLIDVRTTATGSRGYQQGRALLSSRQAVVDMLPQLAIATNDVRCSHGVTTTHLDDAALFYMRSRGLDDAAARQLAIRGFFHQQLDIPRRVAQQLEKLLQDVV